MDTLNCNYESNALNRLLFPISVYCIISPIISRIATPCYVYAGCGRGLLVYSGFLRSYPEGKKQPGLSLPSNQVCK